MLIKLQMCLKTSLFGTQDLIDEFPEGIEIFAGGLRHCKGAAVVPDQQAGRDNSQ
jgi:hypothetical protein